MRRVVLVGPSGPRNVGTAVRAAGNFGPAEVWLVGEGAAALLAHPDFEQMAHGVADPRSRVTCVATLPEALAECTWSVGFTARDRDRQTHDWRALRAPLAQRGAAAEERLALVFGSERYGLSAADTEGLGQLARLPTGELRSINLGVAAALVLYDTAAPAAPPVGRAAGTPLTGEQRELLSARAQQALAPLAEYEALADEVRRAAGRLIARAELEARDAKALHAILRRIPAPRPPR